MTEDEFLEFGARISIVKLTPDEELALVLNLAFLRYMEATDGSDPELPGGVPASLFEPFKGPGSRSNARQAG